MHIEFYQIVSQIIPVLFLGITLQSIFVLKGEKYNRTENFQRNIHIAAFISSVLILVLGEFAALRSVYQDASSLSDLIVVNLSAFFAVVWITLEYVSSLVGKIKENYYIGLTFVSLLFNIVIFIQLFWSCP